MSDAPDRKKMAIHKVYGNKNDGYSETLEFKILNCSNADGNNNKYYCIELQKNPENDHLRLFSQYGRLGMSEVFEIRDGWK